MARLEAGQKAPDFTLQAHDGSTVSLSDLAGQTVAGAHDQAIVHGLAAGRVPRRL